MSLVEGRIDDGWATVADAFGRNLASGRDLGAALCIYVDGVPVVDAWGGVADRHEDRAWGEHTIAPVASTTKGATALCAHMLVERGELDVDAPVVRYWPEFGAAGKQEIPVRWLLSHQAGLPTFDKTLTFEQACAWDPVIRALESQRPLWDPGREHLYHPQTFGFLVGEVVRRITGRSLGTFFAEEVARPLGLSAWIGLPEEHEPRLARVEHLVAPRDPLAERAQDLAAHAGLDSADAELLARTMWGPAAVLIKGATLGGILPPADDEGARSYRAAEFPGSNMHSDARSVARMYASMVSEVDGIRLVGEGTVAAMTQRQTDRTSMHGVPPALAFAVRDLFTMSLGFWRPAPPLFPMLGPASFGHAGRGGSLGFADPEARVGFGYVPNLWSSAMADQRAMELASATARVLG